MADATVNKLRRLVLSATELRAMTDWPPALVEDYLNILDDLILLAESIDNVGDQTVSVTRITATDSPYLIGADDGTIFCNTTNGDIEVTLPVGEQGETHRVVNTGLVQNEVTIKPSIGQKINGSTENEILYDAESYNLQFDSSDGWF